MLEIIVEGSSFLWHQIRCIVAILILIGQKREAPSIIDDLLDIEKYPAKPQYTMSSELPLCLFECEFPIEKVKWRYDAHELSKCVRHLQEKWLESATRSSIIKRMIDSLEEKITAANEEGSKSTSNWRIDQPYSSLQGKSQPHAYVKFEDRQRADTLEQRVDHYVKKRRLNPDVYEKINEANDLAKSLNIYKPNNSSN